MANILPENETVTFEDQTYVNPETSLNEQNTFIDNLRASQARQNAEIQQQTQDLGTAVPSNLGGLVGGEGYFTSRYQTPQTNALVEQLRSTAQAQALSDVLSNQQAMWKQRYNEAYKAAQKRARSSYGYGGSGGGSSTTPTGPNEDNPDYNSTNMEQLGQAPQTDPNTGYYYTKDANGNVVATNDPAYYKTNSGYYQAGKTFEQTADEMNRFNQLWDRQKEIAEQQERPKMPGGGGW